MNSHLALEMPDDYVACRTQERGVSRSGSFESLSNSALLVAIFAFFPTISITICFAQT